MSFTKNYSVTESVWTVIATEKATGFVQLLSDGPVLVQVAQADPGVGSFEGVELWDGGLQEVAFEGLETGDSIYARCRHEETNEVAVVLPGTAPA